MNSIRSGNKSLVPGLLVLNLRVALLHEEHRSGPCQRDALGTGAERQQHYADLPVLEPLHRLVSLVL